MHSQPAHLMRLCRRQKRGRSEGGLSAATPALKQPLIAAFALKQASPAQQPSHVTAGQAQAQMASPANQQAQSGAELMMAEHMLPTQQSGQAGVGQALLGTELTQAQAQAEDALSTREQGKAGTGQAQAAAVEGSEDEASSEGKDGLRCYYAAFLGFDLLKQAGGGMGSTTPLLPGILKKASSLDT